MIYKVVLCVFSQLILTKSPGGLWGQVLLTPITEDFPGGSDSKASAYNDWIRSLGWEDPLEKEMTNHTSTLAWKIPWTEDHGRLQFTGSQRVGHD